MDREPAWTASWLARRGSSRFSWPSVEGRPANQRLVEDHLGPMTAFHCAWCDAWSLPPTGHVSVDHVRPKGTWPELAYRWENLLPACNGCQSEKREQWDDALIRPDDPDFRFEHYFAVDYATGVLRPNPAASTHDQARAARTIAILGLNRRTRPGARLRALRLEADEPPDARNYRFMFDLGGA